MFCIKLAEMQRKLFIGMNNFHVVPGCNNHQKIITHNPINIYQ